MTRPTPSRIRIAAAGAIAWALLFSSGFADTLITPDNPAINYYGRFDATDPKAPRFNWSGTTIEFLVSASSVVGVELTDGAGYFDIEVDGKVQPSSLFAGSNNSKRYDCVTGLSAGDHIIRIIRRNEPYWVVATFSGIYLSNGAQLKPLAKPARKMEFCGDSFTAGYFIEACDDQQARTNANKSWARLTSRAFRAQDILLAESGIGLAKSLGGKSVFPAKYPCTLDTVGSASSPRWNFSSWVPDIVTIFLGINDKSCGVTDNEYATALHSFAAFIRGNYPLTPILFMAYTNCKDTATRAALAAETTSLGRQNIHFLECKQSISGCSWHPTAGEAQSIADSVIAKIRQITGWDTGSVTATAPLRSAAFFQPQAITLLRSSGPMITIDAGTAAAQSAVSIVAINGRIAARLKTDATGRCLWNTSGVAGGMYRVCSSTGAGSGIIIR